jgi:hypothetical protein
MCIGNMNSKKKTTAMSEKDLLAALDNGNTRKRDVRKIRKELLKRSVK